MVEEEKKKHKWVKNVTEHMHKGVFKAKAEAAGESTGAYASEHDDDSGKLGKQDRLAKTLMGMHHSHNKASVSHKTIRNSMYGVKNG